MGLWDDPKKNSLSCCSWCIRFFNMKSNVLALPLLVSVKEHNISLANSTTALRNAISKFSQLHQLQCSKFQLKVQPFVDDLTEKEYASLFEDSTCSLMLKDPLIVSKESDNIVFSTQRTPSDVIVYDRVVAVVNPANHRLSDRGGHANQLIHAAAGSGF